MNALPAGVLKAASLLRSTAYKHFLTKDQIDNVALQLDPNWKSYTGRWIIFETTHWDKLPCPDKPTISSLGSFHYSYQLDHITPFLIYLRSDQQEIYRKEHPLCTYDLVLEVEREKCHAWINAENGKVHKTRLWLREIDGQDIPRSTEPLSHLNFETLA